MEIECREEYIRNSRGVELFTCRWLPLSSPRALIFLCHGYGMECSDFMRDDARRSSPINRGVVSILSTLSQDVTRERESLKLGREGEKFSCVESEFTAVSSTVNPNTTGAWCYIKNFGNIVVDSSNFFKSISAQEEYRDKKRFLYGESMGGAVALLTHRKDPTFWHGAVLVAPMCKISAKVKPHPLVVNILTRAEEIIPKWKVVPSKDVIGSAFKDPFKREEVRNNKLIYQDKPRLDSRKLGRGYQFVSFPRYPIFIRGVTIPFLVLHGEADTVTDPEVSKALYVLASSEDKTIKLYPGMWHALTSGEPDDNVEIVFSDIVAWLDKRCGNGGGLTRSPTIHSCPSVKNFAKDLPSEITYWRKPRRTRSPTSDFCGWKWNSSPMQHHSAI
ncbi:2-acylglycerol O-acyltransferase [Bertholletia excelsa]